MNFLSVLYAKAGITVDGVTTLNNTATGLTPATNDNSTKLATTGYVKNQNYYPYPTGTTAQYVRGDGSLATFTQTGGGGSSVSYYLNGSVSQGTIGGNAYYEMSKNAIIGTNADFNINADGYIAQFVTDAGDPALLSIPGGNWNFEMWFSASSGGGTPSFYVELYKYDGTTLTLIASGSAAPESITGGTSTDLYITALAVPTTTLTLTDRLAVRVYVNHSGRTITLHTQNGHLCQVITTFTTGLTALNGLTAQVQNFAVGTGGTDFNISSVTDTHTFNLPTASATNRGALSSADWSTFSAKQNAITLTTTGTSGAATLVGSTLNIPQYTDQFVGTVTSVSALTLGTTGTDLSSSVANGTTTPVITLNVPTASATNRGALSSTDWTTFNNKQNALTNPITGTGTTNYLPKFTGASALGDSNLISNSAGNLGLGITPTTNTGAKYIQFGAGAALNTNSTNNSNFWHNTTFDASGNALYAVTGQQSSFYRQINGAHRWYYASAGTAGNAITFTEHMALDASGQLSTVGDATINGVKVGRGAGNIATNTAVGSGTLNANTTGATNTAVGVNALTANTTGSQNTSVGVSSLPANNTGSQNTAIGRAALFTNTTGINNTGLGYQALYFNSVGSNITALGAAALLNNTASNNTAVGFEAATTNTSGTDVTAIGYRALKASTGVSNTAVGSNALTANTTGVNNTALGKSALIANTTGFTNTAIGESVLLANVSGTYNTAIGSASLSSNVSGSNNVAIGRVALQNNTASNNTSIGFEAGKTNTTGANNIFIGYQATGTSATDSNKTWIGNASTTSTWLAGNVLIGTTTDAGYKLDVNGTARVSGNLTIGLGSATENVLIIDAATYSGIRLSRGGTQKWGIFNNNAGTNFFDIYNYNTASSVFSISPTGAATFSSSVTATGNVSVGGTNQDSLLTINGSAGTSHARFREGSTTIGFIGGADGIISGQAGKLAIRGEAGLVLSGQGNSADVIISNTGAATFSSSVTATSLIKSGGTSAQFLKADGSVDSSAYISTLATITGNIDSDYGECFVTFDPVPSGTPPLSSPNIRTINVGNSYSRRTQLAFDYSSDTAFFRRRTEAGWFTWREFIHSGNIGSQSVSYATTAGTANAVAWANISGIPNEIFNYDGWVTNPGYDANTIAGNKSGFTYSNNAPYVGPLTHFAASGYGLQFNASYSGGGTGIGYRTRNGDTATWNSWFTIITSSNIGSQSVSYATTAGALTSMNISQFTNNSGYITSASLAGYLPLTGGNLTGLVQSTANIEATAFRTDGNFELTSATTGLKSNFYDTRFYANSVSSWVVSTTAASTGGSLEFRQGFGSTIKGYVYWDASGFGLLNNIGGWSVRTNNGSNYGGTLFGNWVVRSMNVDSGSIIFYTSAGVTKGSVTWDDQGFGLINNQGDYSVLCNQGSSYGGLLRGTWTSIGNFNIIGAELSINSNATSTYSKITYRSSLDPNSYDWYTGMNYDPTAEETYYYIRYIDGNQFRVYPDGTIYINGGAFSQYSATGNYISVAGFGLYSANYSSYIRTNTTTSSYGAWDVTGAKNGYTGFVYNTMNLPHVMFDVSNGNGGLYYQTGSRWVLYYSYGNNSLGIGGTTTDATYKLYVNGNVRVVGTFNLSTLITNGAVYSIGGGLTNTNPSDLRLKEDIAPLQYGLKEVMALNPVTYKWKDGSNGGQRSTGLIAQDVKEVMPEYVSNISEDDDYLGLDSYAINIVLINAIKELKAEIEILKNK